MAKRRSQGAQAQPDQIEGVKAWLVNASITLDIGGLRDSGKYCSFFIDGKLVQGDNECTAYLKCVFRSCCDKSQNSNEVSSILNVPPVGCFDNWSRPCKAWSIHSLREALQAMAHDILPVAMFLHWSVHCESAIEHTPKNIPNSLVILE